MASPCSELLKNTSAGSHATAFTFRPLPIPVFSFTFSSAPREPTLKRARPLADIDGLPLVREYTKRRRLQLHLFTSRLSAPFAVPPTHILLRPKALFPNPPRQRPRPGLRKAAIMNRIKLDAIEAERRLLELARAQFRFAVLWLAVKRGGNEVLMGVQGTVSSSGTERVSATKVNEAEGAGWQEGKEGACNETEEWKRFAFYNAAKGKMFTRSDPYEELPQHRRPPSPPHELELDRQWQELGLGIGY